MGLAKFLISPHSLSNRSFLVRRVTPTPPLVRVRVLILKRILSPLTINCRKCGRIAPPNVCLCDIQLDKAVYTSCGAFVSVPRQSYPLIPSLPPLSLLYTIVYTFSLLYTISSYNFISFHNKCKPFLHSSYTLLLLYTYMLWPCLSGI